MTNTITSLYSELQKAGTDANELIRLSKRSGAFTPEALKQAGFVSKKIAILGGYTSPFLAALLKACLFRKKIAATVFETEYGLYEQAILAKDEALKAFAPDLCYFYVGTDHLGAGGTTGTADPEFTRWTGLWRECHALLGCDIIQNTFEEPLHPIYGHLEAKLVTSATNRVRMLNLALAARAPAHVHFCDIDAIAARHGRRHWRDENLYDMSKIPVSFDHWVTYAESLATVCAAVWGRTRKCLVLDLDNTLWRGVLGDDGAAAIRVGKDGGLGEAYQRFQMYVRDLKNRGVILAVASKNDEAIAKDAFARRSEMPLKLDDFSAFVANWEPKPRNIVAIAKKLNIGLDSLVFVDDNPAERQLVREQLPEVAVVELPEDPAHYVAALSAAALFETVAVTAEDIVRTSQYQANAARDAALASAEDYESYLRGLAMSSVIAPFDELHLPRITQLINKTNQFNVTTPRYTDAETARFAVDPNVLTRYVTLADRFGDNGLISVFIGIIAADTLAIDTWLMSCRVLKRGVEEFLFRELVQEATKRKLRRIKGTYRPTERNKLVANLFADLGFKLESESPDGTSTWLFDLEKRDAVIAALRRETAIARSNP